MPVWNRQEQIEGHKIGGVYAEHVDSRSDKLGVKMLHSYSSNSNSDSSLGTVIMCTLTEAS